MMGRLGSVLVVVLPSVVLAQAPQQPQQWAPASPGQSVPAQYVPQSAPAQPVQYAPASQQAPAPQQQYAPAPQQYAPPAQPQPQYAPAPQAAPPQQYAPPQQATPQYAPPQQQAPAPQYAPAPQQYAPPQQVAPPAGAPPQYAPAPGQYAPAAGAAAAGAASQYAPPQQVAPAPGPAPQYAPPQAPPPGAPAAGAAAGAQGAGAAAAPPSYAPGAPAPAQLPADAPVKTLVPPGGIPAPQGKVAPSAQGPGTTVQDPIPSGGLAREVYLRDSLRLRMYDNEVYTERGSRQLAAAEFYRLVGRPDLASASEVRAGERGILYTFSFLTFAAGVASGVYVTSTAQSVSAPSCYANGVFSYNHCVQQNSNTKLLGAGLIAGGVVIGGLLATWAALTPDMVTSPDETAKLVEQYNRNLSKRLTTAYSEPRVEVTPMFGKDGGGLAARFTF